MIHVYPKLHAVRCLAQTQGVCLFKCWQNTGAFIWREEFRSTMKIRESLHAEILVPCDHHLGKEKMKASDKNENSIWAPLPSSLTLITTFQQ